MESPHIEDEFGSFGGFTTDPIGRAHQMTSLGYGTMAPWHRTRMVPRWYPIAAIADLYSRWFSFSDGGYVYRCWPMAHTPIIGLVFLGKRENSNRNPLYVMEKTHGFWSFRWRFSKENQLSDDTGSFAKPKKHFYWGGYYSKNWHQPSYHPAF